MKSLAWLHKNSVHRKLVLVVLGTCCASLLAAGVALFVYITFAQREAFKNDSSALAEIITANCVGPVAFGDHDAISELMASLQAKEQLIGAMIVLPSGKMFSQIGRTEQVGSAANLAAGSVWHDRNILMQTTPIKLHGETIATLYLISDFGPLYGRLFRTYALVFGFTFAGAVWFGFAVAARARRTISDPIIRLADSMKQLSASPENLSHTSQTRGGEVGQIADAFNVMVDRVKAGSELTKEIAERSRIEVALRQSEERFRSLFENAPVGLYRANLEGQFLMANRAMLALLGYPSFDELAQVDIMNHVCVLPGYRVQFRECLEQIGMVDETEVQWRRLDGRVIHVRESAKAVRDVDGKLIYYEGCVEDITARKEAAAELQRLHSELVEASRAAGMAEVATGVLHNVGNILNSVSVSAQVLQEQLGRSKFTSLQQGVALMEENGPQLGLFLTDDPRGKLLPGFLTKVTEHVAGERHRWHEELNQLQANIEHMKQVVAMQQDYARISHTLEPLAAAELVEDALRMNHAGLERHRVRVERDFQSVPLVVVDKHKVLQILVNLIRNAKDALDEGTASVKQLRLMVHMNNSARVKILVSDNGVGIPKENLNRVFQHGFTTRRDGHGFGLHSGAIAAKELGGELMVQSDGPNQGATFTLELPVAGGKN